MVVLEALVLPPYLTESDTWCFSAVVRFLASLLGFTSFAQYCVMGVTLRVHIYCVFSLAPN